MIVNDGKGDIYIQYIGNEKIQNWLKEGVMEMRFGVQQILIYLCPKHLKEGWDVQMVGEKMTCIPCEVLSLRSEVERLKGEYSDLSHLTANYVARIERLEKVVEWALGKLTGAEYLKDQMVAQWLREIADELRRKVKKG